LSYTRSISSMLTTQRETAATGGPLRIAIVGCGSITEGAHLPAILACPEVQLVGLVDTSETRLLSLKEKFGPDISGFRDHKELFGKVDAVILALPNFLHAPVGTEFLKRGIPVLCEKPLSVRKDESVQLCGAAKSGGAVLAVGFVTRFFPATLLARHLLETGFLGQLHSFHYEFGTAGGWETASGYNLSRETSGGGVLAISGSHFLDRMLFLFGDVQVVRYLDDSRGGLEANCIAEFLAVYDGRHLPGTVTLSKTHQLANRLQIVGEKGVIIVAEGQSLSVTFFPVGSDLREEIFPASIVPGAPEQDYFRLQLEDFIRAIREQTEPRVTGEQSLKSAALMEECYARAERLDEPWCDATIHRFWRALPAQ
jgi:UDP-N-acetylglucosamine 3-dehydrogenase